MLAVAVTVQMDDTSRHVCSHNFSVDRNKYKIKKCVKLKKQIHKPLNRNFRYSVSGRGASSVYSVLSICLHHCLSASKGL